MTAAAYASPTSSPFTSADGVLHLDGAPVRLFADRAGATHQTAGLYDHP
ncbi:hypothetical protein [Amycolatopsis sp. NPDC051903]